MRALRWHSQLVPEFDRLGRLQRSSVRRARCIAAEHRIGAPSTECHHVFAAHAGRSSVMSPGMTQDVWVQSREYRPASRCRGSSARYHCRSAGPSGRATATEGRRAGASGGGGCTPRRPRWSWVTAGASARVGPCQTGGPAPSRGRCRGLQLDHRRSATSARRAPVSKNIRSRAASRRSSNVRPAVSPATPSAGRS